MRLPGEGSKYYFLLIKKMSDISGDISEVQFDTLRFFRVIGDIEIPEGKTVYMPGGTVLLFESEKAMFIRGGCHFDGTPDRKIIISFLQGMGKRCKSMVDVLRDLYMRNSFADVIIRFHRAINPSGPDIFIMYIPSEIPKSRRAAEPFFAGIFCKS